VQRREFLKQVAIGSTALAVGCGGEAHEAPPPPVTPVAPTPVEPAAPIVSEPVPPLAPAPAPAPTPAAASDWAAFARSLDGRCVRPDAHEYALAHEVFDPRFDSIHPEGIAFCASEADVQRSIAFARAHALPFTARCGGHSYEGYSTCTGLVCDVGPLGAITIDASAQSAVVGAGARLIDVYSAIGAQGLALPAGTCPSVGIAGLALGGGQGVVGRKLGLTCDSITSVRIVTADGEIRTCDETQNADLFWACRGGGGGNFGVVTSFTFRLHPIALLSRFSMSWTWAHAADVLAAWQEWAPSGPDELWSKVHFNAAGSTYGLGVVGVYVGSESELGAQLDAFRARVGSAPRSRDVRSGAYLETMLVEASCSDRTLDECHLPTFNPAGTLGRRDHVGHSDFFDASLSTAGIQALLASIEDRGADPLLARGAGGVGLDALGGAINRVAPDATAFVHRSSRFLAQYSTHWAARSSPEVIDANVAWLDRFHAAMRPHASGFAYQNYIDARLPDWQHAYYGANLARLSSIKTARDPDGFFRFAQSIPT
jgi:FAD/FMN-containing dehydrogenase